MAEPGYLFLEGEKLGKFECDFTKEHKNDLVKGGIPFLSFASEVNAPRDIATNQASGRRQFKAVVFTKQLDSTSPMFWQAITQNELIKKAEFRFFRITKTNSMELYYTVTLEKANLSSVKMIMATESEGGDAARTSVGSGLYAAREEIALHFEKIAWEHKIAKKMAEDAWATRI